MKDLYIVSSPFQLISALSAINSLENKYHIVILKTINKKGNDQIDLILDQFNLKPYLTLNLKINILIRYLEISRLVKNLAHNEYNNVFIGDYRQLELSVLEANIIHKRSYILDDGGATNTLQNIFRRNGNVLIEKQKRLWIKTILIRIMGLEFPKGKVKNLYTFYDLDPLPGQEIRKNDIKNITDLIEGGAFKAESSSVYFIGSSLVENNIVDGAIYFTYLEKIKNYFESKNMQIIYLPHRIESEEKLQVIKEMGYKIEHTTFPVEIEFILKGTIPKWIASFFSTALFTLSKIFPESEIYSFKILEDHIEESHQEHIESLYISTEKIAQTIKL